MKKTLALLLALALVFSSLTVAFAEETISADAKAVSSLGMLVGSGDGVTSAYLATTPNRIQAAIMVLRLKGQEEAAKAFTGVDNFADAKDAAWAAPIMAYLKAHPEVGFGGIGNDKFNPNGLMDVKSYYKVMLETLGYKQNTSDVIGDFTYPNVLNFAAEKGLKAVATVTNFTVNDLATATIETLKATVNGGTKSLAVSLVDAKILDAAKAQAAGVYAVAPTALAVDSITITNLREMVVKFNTAPVAEKAKDKANYTINGNAPEAATLSADGLTVTLRTSAANHMSAYSTDNKLVILKAVGFAADTKVENIVAKDTTVPTILSAMATGPRTIKVTFSEPLTPDGTVSNTVNSFKLDNATVALDTTQAAFSGSTLTLTTLADLADGSHTLQVVTGNYLVDAASFGVVPASVTFAYAKDTTPLSVTVDKSTETSVTIKFNKAIDPATIGNANVLFSHTYNTSVNRVDGTAVSNEGDNQTFTINFGTSKPLPPGNTNLYIGYNSTATGATLIADGYGNKLAATTLVVSTTADVTKPVVEKVEFKTATTIQVTFSEKVTSATAEVAANYTLKDSAGDAVTVSGAAFVDATAAKVVQLTTATMNGGSYSLTVKNIKDLSIAQNKLDDVTIAFTATDKVAPTIVDKYEGAGQTGIQVAQIGAKKVKITFSEAMDVATLTDKNNYQYNGAALGTDDKVEAADNNKAVIITFVNNLPTAATSGILNSTTITVARIKDVAGNWMEAFSTTVGIGQLAPLTPYSAQLVAKNQIKLRFKGEVISGAVVADFGVTFNSAAATITGIATSVVDGDTYITLTTGTDAPNTTGATVLVSTAGGASTTGAKNAYGNALAFSGTGVTDKCAPTLGTVVTRDSATANNKIDKIELTYSEPLYVPSISDSDYTVEGYEITSIGVASNIVTLYVKEKDIVDGTVTPKVTQVGDIEDANRNKLGAQEAKTATDGIMFDLPVKTNFAITNGTSTGKIAVSTAFSTYEAVKVQYALGATGFTPSAFTAETATFASAYAVADMFANLTVDTATQDVYARFVDAAGNASNWVKLN